MCLYGNNFDQIGFREETAAIGQALACGETRGAASVVTKASRRQVEVRSPVGQGAHF